MAPFRYQDQYVAMRSAYELEVLSQTRMRERIQEAERERLADEVHPRNYSYRVFLAALVQAIARWVEPGPLQQEIAKECPVLIELIR
jgi:hypothetical protein